MVVIDRLHDSNFFAKQWSLQSLELQYIWLYLSTPFIISMISKTLLFYCYVYQIRQMHQPVKNALETLGYRGKYQKLLVAFLFFIAAEVNYLLFGPTFIYMNPLFECSFTSQLVDESIACHQLKYCRLHNDFTIVAAANLYCDGQVERSIVQSITYVGAFVGLIVVNSISVSKGKKTALIVAQAVAILGISLTILGGYTASVPILAIAQFLCGFSGNSMIIMAYIIPSEFCDDEFRQKALVILNYAWALTMIMIGVLYYVYNRWDNFLILFVLIPTIGVFLVSLFFLVEGPNYLYGAQREKECLESLRVIAIYNNTLRQFEIAAINFKYESSQVKQQEDMKASLKELYQDKYYFKMLIILIMANTGGNLYYSGTNFALDEIGLDYGANMISNGAIQLLSFITLQFTITRLPRRKGLVVTYSTMAILGMLYIIKPIQQSQAASLVIIGICRYIGTICYTVLIMMLTQSFPLKVQSICAGAVQAIAQFGGFLGPIIITICIDFQIFPLIILSAILFVIVVIPLLAINDKKMSEQVKNQTLLSEDASQAQH